MLDYQDVSHSSWRRRGSFSRRLLMQARNNVAILEGTLKSSQKPYLSKVLHKVLQPRDDELRVMSTSFLSKRIGEEKLDIWEQLELEVNVVVIQHRHIFFRLDLELLDTGNLRSGMVIQWNKVCLACSWALQ